MTIEEIKTRLANVTQDNKTWCEDSFRALLRYARKNYVYKGDGDEADLPLNECAVASFIVHAREDIKFLLEEIEKLYVEIKKP